MCVCVCARASLRSLAVCMCACVCESMRACICANACVHAYIDEFARAADCEMREMPIFSTPLTNHHITARRRRRLTAPPRGQY